MPLTPPAGRPMSRTSDSSKRIGHAILGAGGAEQDLVVAVGDGHADEAVLGFQADGDDAAFHGVAERLEQGLFHDAQGGGEEQVLAFILKVADRKHLGELFILLHLQQVGDRPPLALPRSSCGTS